MVLSSNNCPALVLNADYQPLSYYPLSTWSWKNALKAVFLERVNVVSQYNEVVRSPSVTLKLPGFLKCISCSNPRPLSFSIGICTYIVHDDLYFPLDCILFICRGFLYDCTFQNRESFETLL